MKFVFLGDTHGNLNHCHKVCKANPTATIIQVGDFGAGFFSNDIIERLPPNFKFFPGNHDNRREAILSSHCLGHYGEAYNKFFFVSGTDSYDKDRRISGINWWDDEELTYTQAEACLAEWEKSNVDILVAHDCPQTFCETYYLIYSRCLTRNLLDSMIKVRKPKLLITGHHHKPIKLKHDGIDWVSLKIDETFTVDI